MVDTLRVYNIPDLKKSFAMINGFIKEPNFHAATQRVIKVEMRADQVRAPRGL